MENGEWRSKWRMFSLSPCPLVPLSPCPLVPLSPTCAPLADGGTMGAMSGISFDQVEAARLLRELATELLAAEGTARNGLFLELHRLEDTIFRLALEAHPDAPPGLAARAFSLEDTLPAPQVVRELQGLSSPLATPEIRNLYKHMNMARNNMAHDAALARVTVSRSNSKRMAHLAQLLAAQLDPSGEAIPLPPAAGQGGAGGAGRQGPPASVLGMAAREWGGGRAGVGVVAGGERAAGSGRAPAGAARRGRGVGGGTTGTPREGAALLERTCYNSTGETTGRLRLSPSWKTESNPLH